jgi:hypothetical protein
LENFLKIIVSFRIPKVRGFAFSGYRHDRASLFHRVKGVRCDGEFKQRYRWSPESPAVVVATGLDSGSSWEKTTLFILKFILFRFFGKK